MNVRGRHVAAACYAPSSGPLNEPLRAPPPSDATSSSSFSSCAPEMLPSGESGKPHLPLRGIGTFGASADASSGGLPSGVGVRRHGISWCLSSSEPHAGRERSLSERWRTATGLLVLANVLVVSCCSAVRKLRIETGPLDLYD